jgi:hypothetical protein
MQLELRKTGKEKSNEILWECDSQRNLPIPGTVEQEYAKEVSKNGEKVNLRRLMDD